ncbi:MAG TPA: hypothetical protein VGE39_13295 [Prosthecobacter sp.]
MPVATWSTCHSPALASLDAPSLSKALHSKAAFPGDFLDQPLQGLLPIRRNPAQFRRIDLPAFAHRLIQPCLSAHAIGRRLGQTAQISRLRGSQRQRQIFIVLQHNARRHKWDAAMRAKPAGSTDLLEGGEEGV